MEFFKKEGVKNKRVAKFQFFQFLKDVKNDIFDTKIKVFFAAFLSIFIILSVYGYIVSYINPSSLLESYYSNRVSIEVLDEKYKSLISTKDEESTFFLPDIEKTQLPLVIKSLHSMLENKNECKDIRILSAKTQCYYNLNNFVDRVAFKDKVASFNILQRWIASYWIISELSEDKILQFYLNFAYFGKDMIGFESAAKKIFKKTYKELNLKENIFLVSLIYKYNRSYYQNYNPEINQETLLNYMIDKNIIDQSQIANLDNTKFEEIPYNDNLYYMIYDDVMKKNVLNLKKYHNIRVTTTFNSDLSNILASLTKNVLLANDIPNASVVIVKKGQVKVSFTQAVSVIQEDATKYVNKDLDKDLGKENKDTESSVKTIYFNKFPIFVANLAFKPFIYLIALDNNISVPNNFLTSTYETLFSDYYLYKEEKDEYYQQFVKNANILASIKKFSLLEKQLMGKIGEEKLTSFLKTFKLSIVKNPFNYKDVYHGDLIKSDLFNATSLFYTIGNAGTFGNYYYIKKINNFYSKKYKEEKIIDVANLKYIEESFQQKIYSSNRTEFYLTVDRNVAFAFNNEYVVAIWLGDMDKTALENFEKNITFMNRTKEQDNRF